MSVIYSQEPGRGKQEVLPIGLFDGHISNMNVAVALFIAKRNLTLTLISTIVVLLTDSWIIFLRRPFKAFQRAQIRKNQLTGRYWDSQLNAQNFHKRSEPTIQN